MSEAAAREEQFAALQSALAGTWSLERELGRGGMGTVYLARDVALERPVAIKVLDPELAQDAEQRERFLREARIGARLSHPHIVPIYAVEEAAGSVYIVMGLVDGESLRERIHRDGPLPPVEALRLLREIGWALAYAHAMGTLHRDVTLDNILIDRRTGRAMLADFGIAGEIDREDAGPLVGTPAYMAPELVQGEAATAQSDLYALGITAWAMLAGRLPFQAEESGAVLLQQLTEPVPSLSNAAPATPSRLVRAIEGCLAKDPAERPTSVEAWLATIDGESRQIALAGPLEKWVDQWRQVRAFYALGLSVAAMFGGMSIGSYGAFGNSPLDFLKSLFMIALPILVLIWALHRWIEARMLRRAARAGYRLEDLRLALRRYLTPVVDGLKRQAQPLPIRIVRAFTRTSLGVYLGIFLLVLLLNLAQENWIHLHPLTKGPRPHLKLPWYFVSDRLDKVLGVLMRWAYVGLWCGLGLQMLMPLQPTWFSRWRARRRLAFWNSGTGAVVYSLASIGVGEAAAPEETLHRPTELMLDFEIEDLWHALPAVTRRATSDVPVLAKSLRQRVAQLKELSQSLEAPSLASSPELHTIRQRLATRQEAGVTALERLRMMLCQLGGVAAPDGAFTEQLHDLRAVEEGLLEELGAHAELRKLLKKGRRHGGMTPAPTPA